MYQPGRGAARLLGPCLRAYQARPQVRGGEAARVEGAGRDPLQSPHERRSARPVLRRRIDIPPPGLTSGRREGTRRAWGRADQGGGAVSRVTHETSFLPGLGGQAGLKVGWQGATALRLRLHDCVSR